ncbi:MAG TPA: MFS transporter [Candidatus Saccharimonadales bacterium]|nr:MFS transporter [Candidatus Saccharimonadales bacterium]
MEKTLHKTFAALAVRNFRLFVFGQGISLCGTWMQTIGLSWLVLKLTHSGTQLGLVVAAQFLPILLFGVFGGVVADRFNKRRVLYGTQTLSGLLALMLGLLVVTNVIQIWMIYAFAAALGVVNSVDNPTRQSFVVEMVGKEYLKNAVTLNSTMVNMARVIGPSIAGVLIAAVGIGECFLVNAVSYVAVLIALASMRAAELQPAPPTPRERGQIRAGLRYVRSVPKLRSTLLMMFIIGTFAYELPVVLPLFATITMHGTARTYSALMAATGVGSIIGGLYTAGQAEVGELQLVVTALLFGLSMLLVSIMPTFAAAIVVLLGVGVLSVMFIALGNTTLQLTSRSSMRGRVMALWSIAFLGTTPIGGPIIGFISDHANPRVGLAVGGLSAVVAAVLGWYIYQKGGDAADQASRP